MKVLSFGSGLDSSYLGVHHLFKEDLGIAMSIFADTGLERDETYENLEFFKQLFAIAGIPLVTVRKDGENIFEFLTRLGSLPLLPQSRKHTCSVKFKGDVIKKYMRKTFPGVPIEFLIGIEAEEKRRVKRFSKPTGDEFDYEYPLMDQEINRDDCYEYLKSYGISVSKSACQCCPYAQIEEIVEMRANPVYWMNIKTVESRFQETSPMKHGAWIAAGKPLRSNDTCFPGHWQRDTWAEGGRLFAKKINGKQLSVDEWEKKIDAGEFDNIATLHPQFKMNHNKVLDEASKIIESRLASGQLKRHAIPEPAQASMFEEKKLDKAA